jgi:cytochrome P450
VSTTDVPACPMDATRDDRKSYALAAERVQPFPGARAVTSFQGVREVLRSGQMRQEGPGADRFKKGYTPVFFQDGEPHRQQRTAISRFFTPKAISTRHRLVMERTSDELLGQLRAAGTARLDDLSYELAVAVAAEIIGLNDSDRTALAKRVQATLLSTRLQLMSPVARFGAGLLTGLYVLRFFYGDVRPAIKSRRAQRQEDVISHLIDQGYSSQSILIECMTYAVAGMVTTREFIVMAAWHMFDNEDLRVRFVTGSETEQVAILEEILRLEPVASMLHRRATAEVGFGPTAAKDGDVLALNVRAANVDPEVVGECPHMVDPDRAAKQKTVGSFMSFGDGSHRCPGSQVAIAETRVFLDRLMRLPGLKLAHTPNMTWCDGLMSYELRDAIVTCDPATDRAPAQVLPGMIFINGWF